MNGCAVDTAKDFVDRVSDVIRDNSLVRKGETVLVACSGGVDSMVLLHVLNEIGGTSEFYVAAAHLDHRLRGLEGREDQRLVARFCRERGLPFIGGEEDVAAISQEEGISMQDAARRVRYDFLRKSLSRIRGDKIATGHHSDDLVETVLMRLLRGTGPRGLKGIPVIGEGVYIRPLLNEWKEAIVSYSRAVNVPYREDPSNAKSDYDRNRVRNFLIPALEDYNPSVREAVFRLSRWAAEEGEFVDHVVSEIMKGVEVVAGEDEIVLNRSGLLDCDAFVVKEIIRRGMIELGTGYGPQGRVLELALDFTREAESGRRMDLSADLVIGRDFDEIFITRKKSAGERLDDEMLGIVIEAGWKGDFRAGDRLWKVRVDIVGAEGIEDPRGGEYEQYFDLGGIDPPLRIRNWRHGDVIVPFGLDGRKKVSDLLVEEGVPRRRRDTVPVLEDGHSILWLVGVRRSGRGRVSRDSGNVARIRVEPVKLKQEA